jgi:hypothetical protein
MGARYCYLFILSQQRNTLLSRINSNVFDAGPRQLRITLGVARSAIHICNASFALNLYPNGLAIGRNKGSGTKNEKSKQESFGRVAGVQLDN